MNRLLAYLIAAIAIQSVRADTTITPLVAGGDAYGLTNPTNTLVNSLITVEHLTVNNSGEWMVDATGNGSVSMVIRGTRTTLPGAVLLEEANPTNAPAGTTFIGFSSVRLNNGGNACHNMYVTPPINTPAVYFNTSLLILPGDLVTAPGFGAGTVFAMNVGWNQTYINDLNQIMVVGIGLVDDPAISGVEPAIIRVDNPGGSPTQTAFVKKGDEFPGTGGRHVTNVANGPHNNAFSNAGALATITLDGDPATNIVLARHDGTSWIILAQKGVATEVLPSRTWNPTGTSMGVDINNGGNWVMRGTLDAPLADDTLIVKNGTQIISQEGALAPDPSISSFLMFGFANTLPQIDDSGNVYWYGSWNGLTSSNSGIFRNSKLIIQKGITLTSDGGSVITDISGGQSNMHVSDNGRYMIFEGTLRDQTTLVTRQGAILVDFGCRADYDSSGTLAVQDIFAFLGGWFNGDIAADFDESGALDVQDIFAFLTGWFVGC